jgi:ribosomal protein L11 methyltransferase
VIRLGIRVRAADAEIAFARLEPVLAAGAEEVKLDDAVEFAVYGDSVPSDDEVRALAGDTVLEVVRSRVDSGWAQAWQDHLSPVTAGVFTVRPPWIDGGYDDLVIDPGPSFGAASHPTTRLCLELLRESAPSALADWGTGSGVLAIAAARLGFAPVVAVELDSAAAHVARRNAARNGVDVEVAVGDVTRDAPWAPTIVANLTLPLLVAVAAAAGGGHAVTPTSASGLLAVTPTSASGLLAVTPTSASGLLAATPTSDSGGAATAGRLGAAPAARGHAAPAPTRLIASGVLAGAADEAVAAWAPLGFVERERRELDGWAALVLERGA